MPQQWRLYLYNRSRAGATPEDLQRECGMPADEIALRVEAARLCFEKQCLWPPLGLKERPEPAILR
jgi:hypothetical protein